MKDSEVLLVRKHDKLVVLLTHFLSQLYGYNVYAPTFIFNAFHFFFRNWLTVMTESEDSRVHFILFPFEILILSSFIH